MKPEFLIPTVFILALVGWLAWVSRAEPPVRGIVNYILTNQAKESR
jgi:hypothetical protein